MSDNNEPDAVIAWLADHWPKATIFLATYSTNLLVMYLREENWLLFLI